MFSVCDIIILRMRYTASAPIMGVLIYRTTCTPPTLIGTHEESGWTVTVSYKKVQIVCLVLNFWTQFGTTQLSATMNDSVKVGDGSPQQVTSLQAPAKPGSTSSSEAGIKRCMFVEIVCLFVVMVIIWVSLALPVVFFYLPVVSCLGDSKGSQLAIQLALATHSSIKLVCQLALFFSLSKWQVYLVCIKSMGQGLCHQLLCHSPG